MQKFKLELFDITVRRTQSNQNLRLVFEASEDLEIEKKLIEFRGEKVDAKIIELKNAESAGSVASLEGKFECEEVKVRRLKNGDKLRLVLENMYDKKTELDAVEMRFQDVVLELEKIDRDMFDGDEEE
jgi:hypothetical protein